MKKGIIKNIIFLCIIVVIAVVLIVANIIASIFSNAITDVLVGTGDDLSNASEVLEESDALCREIGNESIVMLKNNGALPLDKDEKSVSLFGIGAYDKAFLLKGVGSGSSTISPTKQVTLIDALEEAGFKINQGIAQVYNSFDFTRDGYNLAEPALGTIESKVESAKSESDLAIVVFSRTGGENMDNTANGGDNGGEIPKNINGRTYLEYTAEEEALLNMVKNNFDKVVVLLNTANTMHAGFIDDEKIDAAFSVGLLGQSAASAIPKLLTGEVNPSARVSDTYVYSPAYDPAYNNAYGAERFSGNGHLQYSEGIYFGYKWYETADAEGYFDDVSNSYGTGYDGVVQYPFGYGLSYTDFEWTVRSVSLANGSTLTEDSSVTVEVDVKNVGEVAGKEVVQLYFTPPYFDGEIEKAHVNLLDFAKTDIIEPGETDTVSLTFSAYDMASYDCYDMNGNGFMGYELDAGEYEIKLMNNAHEVNSCENAVTTYAVDGEGIRFAVDPLTKQTVENRFTGEDAYAGVPIDGSNVGLTQQYMTRADFEGTFPASRAEAPANMAKVNEGANYMNPVYDSAEMPVTGQENDLRLAYVATDTGEYEVDENGEQVLDEDGNPVKIYEYSNAVLQQLDGRLKLEEGQMLAYNEELMVELADYNSDTWNLLLDQMTIEDLAKLVECGGFRTEAIESIGKPLCFDYDGPAGFNTNSRTGNWNGDVDTESWTSYPSETLIAGSWNKALLRAMGQSMGKEAQATGLNGWYAPGVNLHRSAYTARNFEYYSEDPVLSGKFAAEVILGAKENGLYCYIKHFAVSEMGPNPRKVNTWLSEQNLRENYLKPFEIAVKEGKANAMMTSFNRIGSVWAGANYSMNVEVLREEWGFKGSLVTDWSMGDGIGDMNPKQGIRGGNDIWLNPYDKNNNPLDRTNAVDMACARNAAHNILYTLVDTWNYYQFDATVKEAPFAWWIPVLVVFDALAYGGLAFWAFWNIRSIIKKRKA